MVLNSPTVGGVIRKPTAEEIMKSSSVKRCLFGRPDHDELQKQLNASLESSREEQNRRWNYDFRQDAPLPGREGTPKWQWEPMSPSDVPRFYRTKTLVAKGASPDTSGSSTPVMTLQEPDRALSDQNNNSGGGLSPPTPALVTPPSATETSPIAGSATTSTRRAASSAAPTQQPLITDFLQSRKRSSLPSQATAKRPRRDEQGDSSSDSNSDSAEERLQPSC